MKKYLLIIATIILSASAISAKTIYPSAKGWQKADPSELGYSSKKLDKVKKAIMGQVHAS